MTARVGQARKSDRCGLGLDALAGPQEVNRDSGRDQEQSGDRRKRPRLQHIRQKPARDRHEQRRVHGVSPHPIRTCEARLLIAQYDHTRDHQTIPEPDREHRVIEESFIGTAHDEHGRPDALSQDRKPRRLIPRMYLGELPKEEAIARQYHAVPGNTTQLRIFKLRVCRLWQSVLVRRSQRAQMRWERFTPILNWWIPPPRVLHPYPDARFYATHPS